MSNGHAAGIARGIRTLWGCGAVGALTDAQLLARFVESRDEAAELAFAELVGRHGPMVLRVARDVLRDPHSAEDAFQATFLVLARKARSIARPETLGPWLHGVAHRVARKARVEANRRRRREAEAAGRMVRSFEPGGFPAEEALHEEVARLPAPCRVAVVLCYFEDLTYQEAARRLGVTEATVRGRLARARRQLRGRLAARGATARPLPIVPARWIGPTARAASQFARGNPGEIPARVAGLAEGVSRIMTISQLKAAALVVAVNLVAVAAVLGRPRQEPAVAPTAPSRVEATRPRADPEPAAEPIKIALTFDQAVARMFQEDGELRAKFAEIPSTKADILTAGLRANPEFYADAQLVPYGSYTRARPGRQTQYDFNVSYPLDLTLKRRVRTASATRATKVIEAQYQDAARMRVDALARVFGEALAARDLASIARTAVERLERLQEVARKKGAGPASMIGLDEALRDARSDRGDADARLHRRLRELAAYLAVGARESGRLEVVGDLRGTSMVPALEILTRVALANRPDLAASRLGLDRAKADVKRANANLFVPFLLDLPPGLLAPKTAESQRSRLNVAQSQAQMSETVRSIVEEVKEARRRNADALQAVPDVKEKAIAARFALDTALWRHSEGAAELASVLPAAKSADEAARGEVEALAQNFRTRVALNTAVGLRVVQP